LELLAAGFDLAVSSLEPLVLSLKLVDPPLQPLDLTAYFFNQTRSRLDLGSSPAIAGLLSAAKVEGGTPAVQSKIGSNQTIIRPTHLIAPPRCGLPNIHWHRIH
jgi:hypothetical protein